MEHPHLPPRISIVLCTCNGANFLPQQLDSLFAQTYPNLEIIAVDDASTDDTWAMLQQYAARHPKMQVHQNGVRLGYIKNFERACGLSTGAYIALCDQDDYWLPEKLTELAAALGTADLVHCNSALCTADLKPTGIHTSDRGVYQPLHSCLQQAVICRLYGHASLLRRELVLRSLPFPAVLPHDWWLAFNACLGGGIQYLPQVLVHYRQHSHNAVGAVGGKRKGKKETRAARLALIRQRIQLFYACCPPEKKMEHRALGQLADSYRDFGLRRNIKRMLLFFRYRQLLLAVKRQHPLRQWLFCIKMFWNLK